MPRASSILRRAALTGTAVTAAAALATGGLTTIAAPAYAANGVPRYDHVVLVMEENHSFNEVIGSASAPYINNTLAASGALFTNSFAIEHPSEPNYLDLFSGSNQGVTDDSFHPSAFTTANLGQELINAGLTFGGYSEDLPSVGYTGYTYNNYDGNHNPG